MSRNSHGSLPTSVLILFSMVITGCAPRITPPASVQNPIRVVVADSGRHTSLILPAQEGGLIEFAWGDYPWFALNHNTSGDGFSALFFSRGSTLGVRRYPDVSANQDLIALTHAKRILTFNADAGKVFPLRDRLTEQFARQSEIDMVYNDDSKMYFVRDRSEHYWIGHNCNHVTARWLRELGCEIDGLALKSNFEMR